MSIAFERIQLVDDLNRLLEDGLLLGDVYGLRSVEGCPVQVLGGLASQCAARNPLHGVEVGIVRKLDEPTEISQVSFTAGLRQGVTIPVPLTSTYLESMRDAEGQGDSEIRALLSATEFSLSKSQRLAKYLGSQHPRIGSVCLPRIVDGYVVLSREAEEFSRNNIIRDSANEFDEGLNS